MAHYINKVAKIIRWIIDQDVVTIAFFLRILSHGKILIIFKIKLKLCSVEINLKPYVFLEIEGK